MRARFGRALLALGLAAGMLAGADSGRVAATPEAHAFGAVGRIKHVVVFYQENHSFDETLGKFCETNRGRCDGYTGWVKLKDGTRYKLRQSSDVIPSVWHNVAAQTLAVDGGKMDGWGQIPGCYPPHWKNRGCLTYFSPSQIPTLTDLASKFAISDRTFSMYNSPSFGGHIYAAAATQDNFVGDIPSPTPGFAPRPGWGCDSNLQEYWVNPATHRKAMEPSCIPARPGTLNRKKFPYNGANRPTPVPWVPTIFDRLDAKHLSWKLYSSYVVWATCPTFAECQYGHQRANVVSPAAFLTDARANKLPAYSVLLPGGPGGTSQHNGSSMMVGDNWIANILNGLEQSPSWSSTAVFITYDDCGCFYDHVPPGKNPDGSAQGIRVPMVIVSPYAKRGYTDHHAATFASILKFAEETFGLAPLTINDREAYDYASSFDFRAKPSGRRVNLSQHSVPAASLHYVATHPLDPNDPT